MKIKELLETMKNSMVLESPKLRIINGEKHITRHITVRLSDENYDKYANREVISWDLCPTSINFKNPNSTILHGYLVIEVKDED